MQDDDEKFIDSGAMAEENEPAQDEQPSESEDKAELSTSASDEGDQSDKSEEADTSDGKDSTGKPLNGVQKRISQLTAEKRETAKERDYWKTLYQEQQKEAPKPDFPVPPDPSLRLDKPEQYQAEMTEWQKKVEAYNEQFLEYRDSKRSIEASKAEAEQISEELKASWANRVSEFKKTAADFDAVVSDPQAKISKNMVDIALRSDSGPAVLYEIARNPEVAARMYNMNPVQTALEVGKIEARLAVKPKTQSQAPDPVVPVSSNGESGVQMSDDMPIEQWVAMERKRTASQL